MEIMPVSGMYTSCPTQYQEFNVKIAFIIARKEIM